MYSEIAQTADDLFKNAVITERNESGRKVGDFLVVDEPGTCTDPGNIHVAVVKLGRDNEAAEKSPRLWCYCRTDRVLFRV